jgi:hypothetical protein
MAKVTIIIDANGAKHTIEQSTPFGHIETGAGTARLLLAAMSNACKLYKAEIADEVDLFRQFLAAYGYTPEASDG